MARNSDFRLTNFSEDSNKLYKIFGSVGPLDITIILSQMNILFHYHHRSQHVLCCHSDKQFIEQPTLPYDDYTYLIVKLSQNCTFPLNGSSRLAIIIRCILLLAVKL